MVAARCLPTLPQVEVFYPVVNYNKRTREGPRSRQVPLFPGYLFARFPLEAYKQVSYTLGVGRVVRRGLELVTLPMEVMRELFILAPNGAIHLDDPDFKIGQKIKIISGIFTGLEGKVVSLAPAKKRVAVLLEFLGQERPVSLPLDGIDLPDPDPRRRFIGGTKTAG
jgi:transcriptional antiterminator RfaH